MKRMKGECVYTYDELKEYCATHKGGISRRFARLSPDATEEQLYDFCRFFHHILYVELDWEALQRKCNEIEREIWRWKGIRADIGECSLADWGYDGSGDEAEKQRCNDEIARLEKELAETQTAYEEALRNWRMSDDKEEF